jgi:NAD(P)-dependent dehydrogenase (short-subunit alcohol dehydrogenase family)
VRVLEGRVVVLTGAAGLLGRAHARTLHEAGAKLVLLDTDLTGLTALSAELADASDRAVVAETDVANRDQVRRAVDLGVQRFGRIDVLVNNAAIDPKFDRQRTREHAVTFEDFPLDTWNASMAVNVTGMFLCAQAVAGPMLERGSGVIITSPLSGVPRRPRAHRSLDEGWRHQPGDGVGGAKVLGNWNGGVFHGRNRFVSVVRLVPSRVHWRGL